MTQFTECANEIIFRNITDGEIRLVHEMEFESFPEDEADSYETFVYRQREAPDLFLGCYLDGCLVGFINATRYHGDELTDECMKTHEPDGESVCVHSVVVQKKHRRKGIALNMLHVFIDKVKREQNDVSRILLLSKSNLIPLYTRAGFVLTGRSNADPGKDTWYELQVSLIKHGNKSSE